MRKIVVFIFLVLSAATKAQCSAEAGSQVSFCADGTTNYYLEGQGGGQAPLTYSWFCEPVEWQSGLTFYTHHLLNDTAIAQPQLTDPGIADSVLFYLQVSDGNGCTAMDSVLVVFSLFSENFVTHYFNLPQGDSIFMDFGTNVFGGISPLSYSWHPGESLSDSTSLEFWASPETTTSYFCTVTDALGCTYDAAPYYFVNVYGAGTEESEKTIPEVIYDPSEKTLKISGNLVELKEIKLFDVFGKLYVTQIIGTVDSAIEISVKNLVPGIYFLESEKFRKTILIY
ncbi:MAG: hypothetical protein K0R65_2489 [Crocinitomicaceae bacterium]|jgi:hypothetical protein|nr:hypothetical protein [Crocinitomicaceae bacterium]